MTPVKWVSGHMSRAYQHPAWIPVLSGIAVLALVGMAVMFVLFFDDQANERRDRVEDDLAACERVNEARRNEVRLAEANEELVRSILNESATSSPDPKRSLAFLQRIEPLFGEYEDIIRQVEDQILDCDDEIND